MRSILEGEVEVGELGEAVEWKVVEKVSSYTPLIVIERHLALW